jgi:hypothetical protein
MYQARAEAIDGTFSTLKEFLETRPGLRHGCKVY